MRRHRSLLVPALLAVAALVLPACSSTASPDALRVNGTSISRSEFEELVDGYADNEAFVSAQAAGGQPITGDGPGTLDAGFVRALLSDEITQALVRAELDERGVEVSESARTEGRTLTETSYGADVWAGFASDIQDGLAMDTARLLELAFQLTGSSFDDESLRARYDANVADYTPLRCMSHILAEGEADAYQLLAELEQGAVFEQLATSDRNTDTAAAADAGSLGCYAETDQTLDETFLAAAFDATPGQVTQPVETQFGWHLIKVTGVQEFTFEESREKLRDDVLGGFREPLNDFLSEGLASADIEVDPRYGHWDPATMSILEDRPAPTTVAPSTTAVPDVTTTGAPTTAAPTTAGG